MVVQLPVKELVVGSNPTRGASERNVELAHAFPSVARGQKHLPAEQAKERKAVKTSRSCH